MLRWFLLSALVVVVLFVGIGFVLPSGWKARAERHMRATPEQVETVLLDGVGWCRWWPTWADAAAAGDLTVEPLPDGSGAKWVHTNGQKGVLTFEPHDGGVTVEVEIHGSREVSSVAWTEVDGGVDVVWTTGGDVGANPLRRWVTGTGQMKDAAEANLRLALEGLARLVEAPVKAPAGGPVETPKESSR